MYDLARSALGVGFALALPEAAVAPGFRYVEQEPQHPFIQEVNWSPDGRKLALTIHNRQTQGLQSWIVAAKGGKPRLFQEGPGQTGFLAWSPDGKRVAFFAKGTEPGALRAVFVSGPDGKDRIRLTPSDMDASSPSWSPDGKSLAFNVREGGVSKLFRIDADGGNLKKVTEGQHWFPQWSTDGKRIACYGREERGQKDRIYVLNSDGTGLSRITDGTSFDVWPTWAPEGRLLFSSDDGKAEGLFTMRPDGSDKKPLVPGSHFGRFSPDGKRIAYCASTSPAGTPFPDQKWAVFDCDADGRNSRKAAEVVLDEPARPTPPSVPADERPWKIRIAGETEPGIPMLVTGRVVDQNGRPVSGVKLYVFHTDATGRYNSGTGDESNPRLKGTLWTNAEGKFEFRTIRPGVYPGQARGEHFHMELSEGGISLHKANISFWEDRPVKLTLDVTGSPRIERFNWKSDPEIGGQRLEIELPVRRP